MTRNLRVSVALLVGAVVGAGIAPALARATPSAALQPPLPASDYAVRPVCAAPSLPDLASCLAMRLVPLTAAARAHTHLLGAAPTALSASALRAPSPGPAGAAASGRYGVRPQDLHRAYELPTGTAFARAQTIAIVDAYDDPTAESDLAVYDEEFGLPPCTSANGCFRKLNQEGNRAPLPSAEGEWATEIALDVETAHAVCETCRIILVEADSPAYADLEAAEQRAAALGATEISNSWGGEEPAGDSGAFNHPGIAVTAATGDYGYRNWDGPEGSRGFTDYPASSPHVVAVGGTRLRLGSDGSWAAERVWNGQGATGGGCSDSFGAPYWQRALANWPSVGCGTMRAVADVAADADPYTGAAVYDSTPPHAGDPPPGWLTLGGTSLASPIIAATFALAGGVPGASSYGAQALYEGARTVGGSMHAVGSGSNGECAQPFNAEGLSGCTVLEEAASCGDQAICVAGQGYSGPAGLGTPEGICAFQPLGTCTPARGSLGSGSQAGKETRTPGGTTSTSGADTGARSALGGAPPPSAPPGKARAASVSHFSLTPRALAALHRARGARRARPVGRSQIAFTYVLSRADHVSVTLERQVGRDGKARWRAASPVATLSARAGRNRGRLAGAAALTPGAYLLTLRPARGPERSLRFTVR